VALRLTSAVVIVLTAANCAEPDAERFIRRIKRKIADGLALRADTAVTDTSNAKNRDAHR